jgi:N-acyl-L-homoserine lactone synthetase
MITTGKVEDAATRNLALQVVGRVYREEKNWIKSVEQEIPVDIRAHDRTSWFLALVNGHPAGVLRLFYDPPLELPPECQATFKKGFDPKKLTDAGKFVEIGRFMILPEYRKKVFVALRLMGAAVKEVVDRNYTHFITDVFEGEPHSPLKFHTRILGFEVIGQHLYGELNCSLTRIILTLDILKAYQRLKTQRNRVYRSLTEGIRSSLDAKLAAD